MILRNVYKLKGSDVFINEDFGSQTPVLWKEQPNMVK